MHWVLNVKYDFIIDKLCHNKITKSNEHNWCTLLHQIWIKGSHCSITHFDVTGSIHICTSLSRQCTDYNCICMSMSSLRHTTIQRPPWYPCICIPVSVLPARGSIELVTSKWVLLQWISLSLWTAVSWARCALHDHYKRL